jgi:F-type H+-transporting ATPase subunit b
MQIDWITVSAQMVNFLILIWLLKRFLYRPVIRAMDQREERIAARLSEAEARRQDADSEAERYRQQSEALERDREEIYARAAREAEERKQQMLDEARAEVIGTRSTWQREADQEKEEFLASLRRAAAEAVVAIARKSLKDLADADLEERIVDVFVERLERLDRPTRQALAGSSRPVRIASGFELDRAARSRLTRVVHEQLAEGLDVEYERSPDLLCGIELTSDGRRLGWNLAQYMEELAERVDEDFSSLMPARGD